MSPSNRSFVLLLLGLLLVTAGFAAVWVPLVALPGVVMVWMSTLGGD